MKLFKGTLKKSKGYTLVELIVAISVFVILACGVAIGAYKWINYVTFQKQNSYAKSLYTIAQQQLTEYEANGTLAVFVDAIEQDGSDVILLADKNKATTEAYLGNKSSDDIWGNNQSLYKSNIYSVILTPDDYQEYLSHSGTPAKEAIYGLFERYLYDANILNASIAIEFSPEAAQVYSVFYTDTHGNTYSFNYSGDSSNKDIQKRDYNHLKKSMIGYYGVEELSRGFSAKVSKSAEIKDLKLTNSEVLDLSWTLSGELDALGNIPYTIEAYNNKNQLLFTLLFNEGKDSTYTGSIPLNATVKQKSTANTVLCTLKASDGSILYNQNFPVIAYMESGYIHVVLDAADLEATSIVYYSNGGKGLKDTMSFHRFEEAYKTASFDIASIHCKVEGKKTNTYQGASSKTSNDEHPYFAKDATNTKIEIANVRHLYNVRFVEDSTSAAHSEATNYLNNYKGKNVSVEITKDLNWNDFKSAGNLYLHQEVVKDSGTTRYDFPSIIQLRSSDTLNGKNHTLKGFTITSKANQNQGYGSISTGIFVAGDQNTSAGLFLTNYGLMKDLTLDEIIVEGEEGVGAFCGVDEGKGLENLTVGHHMNCGDTESSIKGIHLVGGITGTHYKGETASITYKNLKNYATVQETENSSFAHDFGGIVGNLTASSSGSVTIDHCYNYGPVLALKHTTGVQSESLGGIVGYAEGDSIHIVDCESSSQYISLPTDLTDYMNGWYVGGIVGFNKGALLERCCTKKENDSSEGYVFGDRFVGGTVGFNYDTEMYTLEGYGKTNESHVLGKSCVGGVLGYNPYGIVQNWNVTGFVAGSEEYVGGVVGYNGNNKEFKLQDGTPAYYAKTTTQTTTVEVSLNNIGDGTILSWFPGIKSSLNDWVKNNTGWKNCKSREEIENYLNNNNKFTPSEIDPTTYNKWYTPKTAVELYWGFGGKESMANAISYELWDASPNNPANTTTSFVAADPPVAKIVDCTVVVDTDGCDAGFNAGCAVGTSTPCTIHYLKDTTIFNSADFVGGMVGYNDGEINAGANKIITPNVIGHDYIGGIAGYNATDAIISLHQVDGGTIEGHSFVGGYTGVNTSLNLFVTGTYDEGNHKYTYSATSPSREIICAPASVVGKAFVGGLTGANIVNTDINLEPKLKVSSTSRTVSGEMYVGGVIGYNSLVKNASREDIDAAVEKAAVTIENNPTLIVNNTLKDELMPETILNIAGKDNTTNTFLISGSNCAFGFNTVSGEIYTAGLIGYNRENTNLIIQNISYGSSRRSTSKVEATSYIYNDSEQPGKKTLTNASFKYSYVGGFVGKVTKNTIIDTCSFPGNVITQGTYTGGLAEINEGFIVNCDARSLNVSKDYVGGLVGLNKNVTFSEKTYKDINNIEHKYTSTTIKNAKLNNSSINGNNVVGGITAENYGMIIDAQAINTMIDGGQYVGGITGWNYEGASITTSGNGDVSYGFNVYATKYAGGIAGGSKGYIGGKDGNSFIVIDQDSYILANNSFAGGAVGYYELKNNVGLAYIKNDGYVVTIMDNSGGIAGTVNVNDGSTAAAIHDCIVTGGDYTAINSMMGNAGGIIAKNNALIENCIITYGSQAIASVTAKKNAGGIAAENNGTIKNCYALPGNDLAASGISWASRFTNSGATSVSVQGKQNSGGIVGDNNGTIIDCCVHEAKITLPSGSTYGANAGGICGHNEAGATLSNVKVVGGEVNSSVDEAKIGGLCGLNESTIDGNKQVVVDGTEIGSNNINNVGGAVGLNCGTLKNLNVKAIINGSDGKNGFGNGGIAGVNDATIEACNFNSAPSGSGSTSGLVIQAEGECSIGGITGINRGTISASTIGNLEDTYIDYRYAGSTGATKNPDTVAVGGIAGRNTGTIVPMDNATLSTKNVTISSSQGYTGGIVGIYEGGSVVGTSTQKLTTGKNWTISGTHSYEDTYVGGIYGLASVATDILYADNYAKIELNTNEHLGYGGGIVGLVNNTIQDYVNLTDCNNYGEINAFGSNVGGIIAKMSGYGVNLKNNINYGQLTGGLTGGIVGKYTNLTDVKTIEHCINFGRIESNSNAGGVIGNNEGSKLLTVLDCVNVGDIELTTNGNAGGIAGFLDSNGKFYRCRNYGNHEGNGTFYGISPALYNEQMDLCLSISNENARLTQAANFSGEGKDSLNFIYDRANTRYPSKSVKVTYTASSKKLTGGTDLEIYDIDTNPANAIIDFSDYERIVKGYEAHVTSASTIIYKSGYKNNHSPALVDSSATEGNRQKVYEEVDPRYLVSAKKVYKNATGNISNFTVDIVGEQLIFKWTPAHTYNSQKLYYVLPKSNNTYDDNKKVLIADLSLGITEYLYDIPDAFVGKNVKFIIVNEAANTNTNKTATVYYTFPNPLAMPRMQVEYMGGNTFSMALTNVEDYESAVSESPEGYVELAVNVNDEVKDSVAINDTTSMVTSVFNAALADTNLMSVTANPIGLGGYDSSEPLEVESTVATELNTQFNGFMMQDDAITYSLSATSESNSQLFKVDMIAKDYLSAYEYSLDVIISSNTMNLTDGDASTELTNIPEEVFNAQQSKPLEVRCYAWYEESDTIWYGHEVVRDLSKDQLLNYVYATYYGSEYPLVDNKAIDEEGNSVVTSTVFYQDETGKVHLKDGYQLAYDTLSDTYTIFYSGILKDNAVADEKIVNLASDLALDIKVEVPTKKFTELYVKKNDSFVLASEGDLGVVQLYAYYNDEYVALGVDETTNALYNPLVEDDSKWIRYEGHRVNAKGQLIDESGVVICDYTEGSLKVQWMDPKAIEYPTTYEYMIRAYVGDSSEVIDSGSYDPSDKEVVNYLAYPTDGWNYSAIEVEIKRNVSVNEGNVEVLPASATKRIEVKQCLPTINDFEVVRKEDSLWTDISIPAVFTDFIRTYEVSFYQNNVLVNCYELPIEQWTFMNDSLVTSVDLTAYMASDMEITMRAIAKDDTGYVSGLEGARKAINVPNRLEVPDVQQVVLTPSYDENTAISVDEFTQGMLISYEEELAEHEVLWMALAIVDSEGNVVKELSSKDEPIQLEGNSYLLQEDAMYAGYYVRVSCLVTSEGAVSSLWSEDMYLQLPRVQLATPVVNEETKEQTLPLGDEEVKTQVEEISIPMDSQAEGYLITREHGDMDWIYYDQLSNKLYYMSTSEAFTYDELVNIADNNMVDLGELNDVMTLGVPEYISVDEGLTIERYLTIRRVDNQLVISLPDIQSIQEHTINNVLNSTINVQAMTSNPVYEASKVMVVSWSEGVVNTRVVEVNDAPEMNEINASFEDETTLLIEDSSLEAGVYEIGMADTYYYRKGVGSIRVKVNDIYESDALTLNIRKAFMNDKLSTWSEKNEVILYAKKLDVSSVPSYPISVEEKEGKVHYCSGDKCWDSLESIDITGILKIDGEYEKMPIRDMHNSLIYVDSNEGIPTKTLVVDGKEYHFDLTKIKVSKKENVTITE